ncbi:MAG: hypothetical protein DWQ42_08160 [Planctomycetota bacterium]|nr:MAG: hypothetical protein DWQ42_08160 [Planctomycetota bacterium]REK40322.1 MAG: hypothetical protein DWQ46_16750 [Planctomycetota bacterium]
MIWRRPIVAMRRVLAAAVAALLATVVAASVLPVTLAAGADELPLPGGAVTVVLRDGRVLSGLVDASAEEALWLRWENSAAVIRQAIDWDEIVAVRTEAGIVVPQEVHPHLDHSAMPRDDDSAGPRRATSRSVEPPDFLPAVRSLDIDVRVANWNADPAVDGLAVTVYPLDAAGRVVPVRGTVTVELVGDSRSLRKPQPRRRFPRYQRLGWWNRPVELSSFDAGGAGLELPFQAFDPETDLAIRSRSLVIVRLAVPGQGLFRASVADVWVRPYSVLRNRVELSTGRRYLRQELNGR